MDVTPEALKATKSAQNWLTENFSDLREAYPNQFIAIKDQEVQAAAPSTDELEEELAEEGIDPSTTLIKYIRNRGQVVIR